MAAFATLRFRLQELLNDGESRIPVLVKKTGMSVATVYRGIRKWKATGAIKRAPGGGRPPKMDGLMRQRLYQLAIHNPEKSNRQFAHEVGLRYGLVVDAATIGRTLGKLGLTRKKPRNVPLLTERHKRLRLAWCLANRNKNFKRVVFTDESRMQFYANCRRLITKKGEMPIAPRMKFGPAMMIWGGISWRGATPLAVVEGSIDSDKYTKVLQWNLLPSMKTLYPGGFVLCEDNAPCHKAKKTKKWMADNGITVLPWPANSPDLNVVENCWGLIKTIMSTEKRTTVADWKAKIEKIWRDFGHDYFQSLIESMPDRIEQCIAAKGGHTRY